MPSSPARFDLSRPNWQDANGNRWFNENKMYTKYRRVKWFYILVIISHSSRWVGSVSYTVLHSVFDLLFLQFLESLVNLCIRFMDLKGRGWCHEMLKATMQPKPHEAPQVMPCTLGELRTRLRNYLSTCHILALGSATGSGSLWSLFQMHPIQWASCWYRQFRTPATSQSTNRMMGSAQKTGQFTRLAKMLRRYPEASFLSVSTDRLPSCAKSH